MCDGEPRGRYRRRSPHRACGHRRGGERDPLLWQLRLLRLACQSKGPPADPRLAILRAHCQCRLEPCTHARDMDGDVPSTPRQLLENLLGQGMVMVTIDARSEGAVVPRQFERDPQLRLNLSYRFGLPITVDEWGVKARLTFSG